MRSIRTGVAAAVCGLGVPLALLAPTADARVEAAGAASAGAVPAKINFQPAAAPVPTGYTVDSGLPYSAGAGFGWVTEASLSSATHTPIDISQNTRDRNAVSDQRYDTLIHMQYPAGGGNGVSTPSAWEYELANGTYSVTVAVGDAGNFFDSTHRINVEGTTFIAGFSPTTSNHFSTVTANITVADGRLTIDASGGANTKLDFVEIASATADTTPPAAPQNVAATPGDGQVQLTWTPNTEPDLAGYNVYRSTTLPVSTSGTPLNGSTKLNSASYLDTGLANGTTYHYVVQAVDTGGNTADAPVISATPNVIVDIKVNFSDANTVPPSGYVRDHGQAYGPRTGSFQGLGLTYGWVTPGTTTPLSLVGNGRNRNAPADLRLATLMHMQFGGTNGVAAPGSWEIAVPNGTYTVTVAVGDSAFFDSTHRINVEGTLAINGFVPTAANPFATAAVTATVSDGRLTIDSNGGTNTKINYVTISNGSGGGGGGGGSGAVDTWTQVNWSLVAPTPLGTHEAGAAVVGGKLYQFGGYVDRTFVPTARAYAYDAAANSWTRIADMPVATTHMGVAVNGTDIYAAGGYPINSTGNGQLLGTTNVWKYDTVANTWSSMPPLPAARGGGALVNLGGVLHFFGGSNLSRADTATHWAFTLGSSTWTLEPEMGAPRNHVAGVALDGKAYAVGGQTGQDDAAVESARLDVYDPATRQWAQLANLPTARSHTGSATFVTGGRIIAVGGETAPNVSTNEVIAYNPQSNEWTQLTPLPVVRNSGVGGTIAGKIYYASGDFTTSTYQGIPDSSAPPPTGSPIQLDVNFQPAGASVPLGYVRDSGDAYGPRSGAGQGSGLTYGWVSPGTTTPLNLVGNARKRGVNNDQRFDTFIHMQYTGTSGVAAPGNWEISLANSTYDVIVSVGDAGPYFDSAHSITVEGLPLISTFVPSGSTRFQIATRVVNLRDGRLTLGFGGGQNTKIDYVTIVPASPSRPSVLATTPATGATNINLDAAVSAEVKLPTVGAGVDGATLNSDSVRLIRMTDNAQMAANVNTSGGGDVIVLQPKQNLDPNTSYRFEVTSGVKDVSGQSFLPYTTTFTTGTATSSSPPPGGVQFEQTLQATSVGKNFPSLAFGPDGKLYATTLDGLIYRFSVAADGTLGTPEVLDSLQQANGGPRSAIGLAFDPAATASNLVLWVSHSQFAFTNADDWTGEITRLSGPNLQNVQDYVVGLPRSIRDHMTNSLGFGPGGALYVTQGSNTASGAPDSAWGNRPEHRLSAAMLRIDVSRISSPPIDVKTEDGGSYDPFAPGAPVTIHASGLRNAYDFVWHSNGRLYVPTNGSSAGGNAPATPSPLPAACSNRIDGTYSGPAVPALTAIAQAQNDYVFRVVQGGYYGHPNPTRCEWVLNGGNPTSAVDAAEIPDYPVGTLPDRNWRGFAHDFGAHYSPNGAIEYSSDVFSGALRGKILVARYSAGDDVIALTPGGANADITDSVAGIPGLDGFTDPIDVVESPGGAGNLYVSEFGAQRIVLLRPVQASQNARLQVQNLDGLPFDDRLVFNRIGSLTSPPANGVHDRAIVRLKNTGTGALTITGLPVSGPWQIVGPPALPATIAAGGTLDLTVRFVAEGGSVWNGTLTIQSNDPTNPSSVVQLAGWWQSISEGGVEPSLTQVVQVFGYKTAITFPGQVLNQAGLGRNVGDEVLSPYWARADTTKPVTVRQIAAFHGCGAGAGIFWHLRGSTALTLLFGSAKEDCQSLLPRLADLSGPATNTLAPGAAFGFTVDGLEWSDDTKNGTGADVGNGCPGPCGHHMRFWLVRDRSGAVVPNQYLMSMDYSGINYDYQDNVFLITNMKPAPPAQVIRRLDVGATANYTDTQGNAWTPDTGLFTPTNAAAEGADYAVQAIDWTEDDPLYITYRAFLGSIPQAQRILTYNIPLPTGVTKVDVRLHYAERFWTANGQRVFNVDIEGQRISTNFDIFRYAPGAHKAMIVPVYNVSVADGSLTIVFTASTDYAAVNAIEVLSNP